MATPTQGRMHRWQGRSRWVTDPPARLGVLNAHGLLARFAPIGGHTPHSVLAHRIWLPVVLNSLTVNDSALHSEYDTISAGQFSQPQGGPMSARQLREVPVDSMVMAWDPAWFTVTRQSPRHLRDALTRILHSKKPVHLLVTFHPHATDGFPEVDMDVTFRSINRERKAGENDTLYLTVSLKEWRDPHVRRRGERPTQGRSSRKHGVHLPVTHTLKASDTLMSLSREYYGTPNYWRVIRDVNGVSKHFGGSTPLVHLPGRWRVGAKVKIPSLQGRGDVG